MAKIGFLKIRAKWEMLLKSRCKNQTHRKNTLFAHLLCKMKWREKDSNLRSRKTSDLQSDAVGHFAISPKNLDAPNYNVF